MTGIWTLSISYLSLSPRNVVVFFLDLDDCKISKISVSAMDSLPCVVQRNLMLTVQPFRLSRFNSYRAVNTLRLSYIKQSANAVQGNNRCLF